MADDSLEEAFRRVAADSMAQGFVIEILLAQYLKTFPEGPMRTGIVQSLLTGGSRTDGFPRDLNESQAELLADIAVRAQGALKTIAERALMRIELGKRATGQGAP